MTESLGTHTCLFEEPDPKRCEACGNEQRDHRGLLTCECRDPLTVERQARRDAEEALNTIRLHLRKMVDAAIRCRDEVETDEERYEFDMVRIDREGILEFIVDVMRNPHLYRETESASAAPDDGTTDIAF